MAPSLKWEDFLKNGVDKLVNAYKEISRARENYVGAKESVGEIAQK